MQITEGKIKSAQKIVVYGPEGIGKSTFAAQFPFPLFIDTEGSTKHMDVRRAPRPTSWAMLMDHVKQVKQNPALCKTLVIDTADWAEQLCIDAICAKAQKTGIEDFGYGKGYVYLSEEFGRLLNLLEDVIGLGINVVFTAHAKMRKFEQPDEMGAYDRWEMKLEKQTGPLLKEWADMVLFANYETVVINVDDQGALKGKNKVQGGKRVMYTTHHPCWDAKNRQDLKEKLPFEFASIASVLTDIKPATAVPPAVPHPQQLTPAAAPAQPPVSTMQEIPFDDPAIPERTVLDLVSDLDKQDELSGVPTSLKDLMATHKVTVSEIQEVVGKKGYYPVNTPISKYDPKFIAGVLVGAWPQVYSFVQANRN